MEPIFDNNEKGFYFDKNLRDAYLCTENGLPLIRFKCFDSYEWMDAVFTTRYGGVSSGCFSELNLDVDGGDDPENIRENFNRVGKALNLSFDSLIKTDQIHSINVSYASWENVPEDLVFRDTDGLYTDKKELALCISGADCVPVFIVDTKLKNISVVHSGWKGTVSDIVGACIKKLIDLGGNPIDMTALIGPSISQKNYEVTKNVIDEFTKGSYSLKEQKDIFYQTDEIHYQLDLWAACFYNLVHAGINEKNIYFSGLCTYDNHDMLFSHRFTKGKRGTMRGIIYKKA